jgi:hypothetical protein
VGAGFSRLGTLAVSAAKAGPTLVEI